MPALTLFNDIREMNTDHLEPDRTASSLPSCHHLISAMVRKPSDNLLQQCLERGCSQDSGLLVSTTQSIPTRDPLRHYYQLLCSHCNSKDVPFLRQPGCQDVTGGCEIFEKGVSVFCLTCYVGRGGGPAVAGFQPKVNSLFEPISLAA